jgi:hypothetical protein
MNYSNKSASMSEARALSNVAPRTRIPGKSGRTIGGISRNVGGGRFELGASEPFGFTHTAAGDEYVKIGDPTGAIEAASGKAAATAYDNGTAFTNAVLNTLLYSPTSIVLVNREVQAAADFSNTFEYSGINLGGSYAARPLTSSFTMSKRNTQQNALLLTAEWPEGLVLGPNSCLFIQVNTTTTTVTFQPQSVFEA